MKIIDIVCIIEDDPIHAFITKRFLDLSGRVKNIMIYKDGKEAYDNLKMIVEGAAKLPELILLDLNMPVWDGWDFLEEFTKIQVQSTITIYILTSSNDPADLERAAKYNLNEHFLVKPITLEQLTSVLEEV